MNLQAASAALHFGCDAYSIESLSEGLIHKTYKVFPKTGDVIILQQVNTLIFKDPEKVNRNYLAISDHLIKKNGLRIPALLKTIDKNIGWTDEAGSYWRAFLFIPDSYTETGASSDIVFRAARCYGEFVSMLFDFDTSTLYQTIPGFHDLHLRFSQFQLAASLGNPERIPKSKELLDAIEERRYLLDFYTMIIQDPEFKIRAMHHDCKLSNILFHRETKQAICPIDLDTVMPGYFFSDVGDMIRSMVSAADENSPFENILIRKDIYDAIINGYQSGIQDSFTDSEKNHLHHAGLIMIYMQAIRFLTDYLSDDVYYKISYPEQNFDRAKNQLTLLEKLEVFLKEEYQYHIN